jgi:hypothetical protein
MAHFETYFFDWLDRKCPGHTATTPNQRHELTKYIVEKDPKRKKALEKRCVYMGALRNTLDDLTPADLVRNKRGKIVEAAKSKKGKFWYEAVMEATVKLKSSALEREVVEADCQHVTETLT